MGPVSWWQRFKTRKLRIEQGAYVGNDVTILPTCKVVGAGARVLDGSVLVHDVPPGAIVAGDPAVIVGYVQD